jgi:hypothetical protein
VISHAVRFSGFQIYFQIYFRMTRVTFESTVPCPSHVTFESHVDFRCSSCYSCFRPVGQLLQFENYIKSFLPRIINSSKNQSQSLVPSLLSQSLVPSPRPQPLVLTKVETPSSLHLVPEQAPPWTPTPLLASLTSRPLLNQPPLTTRPSPSIRCSTFSNLFWLTLLPKFLLPKFHLLFLFHLQSLPKALPSASPPTSNYPNPLSLMANNRRSVAPGSPNYVHG